MKQEQFNALDAEPSLKKKSKLRFEKLVQDFNTLDMNSYGSWPISVKITCYLFVFLLVCLLSYVVLIRPQLLEIESAQAQQINLLNAFKDKTNKVRNTKQYQASLQQMESQFNQQLEQLPKETEIPSLVEDIHRSGLKSGLKFKNIHLENEIQQAFFIEQPILIEAQGGYHSFGQFVSRLAELPRIVTLHDFVIVAVENTDQSSDVPVVEYSLKARTYRYVGNPAPKQQASDQLQQAEELSKTPNKDTGT